MSIARNILNAEYRLLRKPTQYLEDRVLHRLPEESFIRMGAEGGLGAIDAVAGRMTGNREVRERGTAMMQAVKASMRARFEDRRSDHLRHTAQQRSSRLVEDADQREAKAKREVAKKVEDTAARIDDRKAKETARSAQTAGEKIAEVDERANRKRQAADKQREAKERRSAKQLSNDVEDAESKRLDAQRERERADSKLGEAEFFEGVAEARRARGSR